MAVRSVTFRVVEDGSVRMVEGLKGGGAEGEEIKKHAESDTLDKSFEDQIGVRDFVMGELRDFLSNTNLPEKVPTLFDSEKVSEVKISTPKKTVTMKPKKGGKK